jgi:hypothetical protein
MSVDDAQASEPDAAEVTPRAGAEPAQRRELQPATGDQADTVTIGIDYKIIEHFSQHLYGSPNKAIEELVANSYDALATTVDVWVPGEHVAEAVLVWDNGQSMDVTGLKRLWEIARSPKSKVPNRQAVGTIDGQSITRSMIGKFGIGKLASYAVGDRIAHYCRSANGQYLKVEVDYVAVLDERRGDEEYSTPVIRLSREQALTEITSLFTSPPDNIDDLIDRPTWTLARIGSLREDVDLPPGRLSWVIGNGMPLQPDFAVNVNGKAVTAKLDKKARQAWTFKDLAVTKVVASVWQDAARAGSVQGVLLVGPSMSGALPPPPGKAAKDQDASAWVATTDEFSDETVRFPHLGDVQVTIRMFTDSLLAKAGEDRPRTHGFFVMVRGRLVNSEDELLFLNDPSYGSFYRTQFVIHADALDDELLADRERLRSSSPASKELALLQVALNRAVRAFFERSDDDDAKKASAVSLLPTDNRELYRQPLTALLLARDELADTTSDFSDPQVRRVNSTAEQPLSDVDAVQGAFLVNQDHPLFQAVRAQAGSGALAQKFFRIFDVFAVGERLLEGHLYDIGMSAHQVEAVAGWRDRLLRALANRYSLAGEEVLAEVRRASYLGDAVFEQALAKLFRLMGFDAVRDGASGKKDVLTVAPAGPEHYTFTVEAKGSEGEVRNVPAAIASAAAHRDDADADHALVVAREFSGFKRPKEDGVAILKECESTRGVSIITLEVLIELYHAVQAFSYPLKTILPVLTEVEAPTDKAVRVARLTDPLLAFDFRGILEAIWEQQRGAAARDLVPYRSLWQLTDRTISLDEFGTKLLALETLSGGLLVVDPNRETVFMRQSPELVASRIARAVAAKQPTSVDPEAASAAGAAGTDPAEGAV